MNLFQYGRRIIDERQRYRRWIDPRVATLPVADIVAYLEERGWKQIPSDRPHFLVFQEPGTPNGEVPFYQFVPDSEHYPDYGQHAFELLSGIAEFEDRQASAVIDDMLQQAARRSRNGAGTRERVDADVRG